MGNTDMCGLGNVYPKVPDGQEELHKSSCDCQQLADEIRIIRKELSGLGYLCCVCLIFTLISIMAVAGITTWCQDSVNRITDNMKGFIVSQKTAKDFITEAVKREVSTEMEKAIEKSNLTNP